MDHPSEDTLKRFASGTASREENRAVVAHLVKGCSACARTIRALIEPKPVSRSSYETSLDQFDRGHIETLESAIDPLRALPTVPRGVLPDPPEDRPPRKKG
jgi:hypothetical protein